MSGKSLEKDWAILPAQIGKLYPRSTGKAGPTVKNSQAQLDNLALSAPYRFNSETAREAGKKGAIASQKARKRNKTMAQLAKQIAESKIESADLREQLKELGLTEADMQNAVQVVAGVFHDGETEERRN